MDYALGWQDAHKYYQHKRIYGAMIYDKLILQQTLTEYGNGFKDGWESLTQ